MALKGEFIEAYIDASVYPRLRLDIEVSSTERETVELFNMSAIAYIPRARHDTVLGTCTTGEKLIALGPNQSRSVDFHLDLDYYRLEQIEKLREGKDLFLRMYVNFIVGKKIRDAYSFSDGGFWVFRKPWSDRFRIPKVDWSEKLLKELKYKWVHLIEIPEIAPPTPELGEVRGYVDDAWKKYSMGEYDDVLVDCRKAIQAIGTVLRKSGFETEETIEEGKTKKVPDWKKFLGNSGRYVKEIVRNLHRFADPGAHPGKVLTRKEAEMTLHCTHGLISYIIRTWIKKK